jgi:hypothetical protein
MDKLIHELEVITLQRKAYEVLSREVAITDGYLIGLNTEEECLNAMHETEMAVQFAIKQGVSRKDLPAV